jgi:copper chaperone CopZ
MKRVRILAVAAVAALTMAGCRRSDVRTIALSVPDMNNEACVAVVREALAVVPGVQRDAMRFDVPGREVVVVYDSLQLSLKNIEYVVARAGFRVNDIPADEQAAAALPAACRE